jgi:hypothetical protein
MINYNPLNVAVDRAVRASYNKTLEAFKEAANELQTDYSGRIHVTGERTDGAVIGTGTTHKDGTSGTKYEKRYSKKRERNGNQLGYIDFTFSGQLMKSEKVKQASKLFATLVIAGKRNAQISVWLDEMKGQTFNIQDKEKEGFIKDFNSRFKRKRR